MRRDQKGWLRFNSTFCTICRPTGWLKNTKTDKMQFLNNHEWVLHLHFRICMGEILLQFRNLFTISFLNFLPCYGYLNTLLTFNCAQN